MNIFDKAKPPALTKLDIAKLKEKIQSIEEPSLYSFMTNADLKVKREQLFKRGDGEVTTNGQVKSVYADDTRKIFQILNEISPSMCLAKWYNVSIHIPTGKTHSCYHPPAHKVPLKEITISPAAIHNTKYKNEQRVKMLTGVRPDECNFCWDIEDSGDMLSDRAYRSKDVFRPGILKELVKDIDTGNPMPRYVEVNFNQACNFKCAYCSPHLSTEWHHEIEKHGPILLSDGRAHNDIKWMQQGDMIPNNGSDNPYLKAFWEWFPTVYPTLQTFRMTGGEPLMDKNTFKIFEYVAENPKGKDLHLSITSNCCPPGNQWAKFLTSLKELEDKKAIEHFMLYCSLDSWGEQAEYIRNGLDFNVMYKNIREYLRQGDIHSLTFIVTFNALSIPNWMTYIRNILKLRQVFNNKRQLIWFDVPMLMDPNWLSLKILPKEQLEVLKESIEYMKANIETRATAFKGFKDYEIDKVQRLYDWAIQPISEDLLTATRADFHAFYTEHDRRRGTDFKKTFPELIQLTTLSEEAYNKVKASNGQ